MKALFIGGTGTISSAITKGMNFDVVADFIAFHPAQLERDYRLFHGKTSLRTRTHDGLPFPDDYFDIAYTKKGPTARRA